ncbi:MAG TPA: glycine oxidase ThiO [Pyrinomonadaceae bacterium]|jgi:glycine oxidase
MRKSSGWAADVAVVGGGVAGLAAARELARRGLGVTLVEAGAPGAGASGAAAGMLAPQAEADRDDELFGLLCASREMYPAFADALRDETGIDIELDRTGTLYLAFDERDEEEAARRFEWQSSAGLAVERLTAEEARRLEPRISPRVRGALLFPRDWQVENRLLVRALRASAEASGARVVEGVSALGLSVEGGRVGGVETAEGTLAAGAVVVAAGAWSSHLEGAPAAPRVEPVRGQVLCFLQDDPREPFVRHVVYGPRGYLVPRRDGRLLAGSTTERAGFDCRVTEEGVRSVRAQAAEIAPAVSSLALSDSWAGLRPRAPDGLPVIGESAEVGGLFYAAGYYRNGILLAPASGELVADLVTGRTTRVSPRALSTFSPARFRAAHAGPRGK